MKQEYYFSLSLSYDEFLAYYQGYVEFVQVTTTTGLKVNFPAMHLRPYVTRSGIHGKFVLITENNKFNSLIKIA